MVDTRLPASGAVRIRWGLSNAFANPQAPTATELAATLDIGTSVSWNDYSFGSQASTVLNDPPITAKTKVGSRGFAKYGGSISFYRPLNQADTSNPYTNTWNALKVNRTVGYIITSIDGDLSPTSTPLYTNGVVEAFAAGDLVNVYPVLTGGYTNVEKGADAFRYTISFLAQGAPAVNQIVTAGTAPAIVVSPSTATVAIGAHAKLTATIGPLARAYTYGMTWTSADTTKVTVSQNGIVSRTATGTVVVTATHAASGATATSSIS